MMVIRHTDRTVPGNTASGAVPAGMTATRDPAACPGLTAA
jgi:hypothetical protein